MKLTGTNRPTTYTTQKNILLASTMWFPTNNPGTNNYISTTKLVVTTKFPPPPAGARVQGLRRS